MSRPYETLLADQLDRLHRVIAEGENVVSRSADRETIDNLNVELTRQRALRAELEVTLRRTRFLNRFALRAQIAFCVSFAALFVIAGSPIRGTFFFLLFMSDLLLLLTSAAAVVGAIVARDVVARGHQPWRFSLRSLFVMMTMLAVLLSLLFLALQA